MIPWWATSKDDIHFNYPLSGGSIKSIGTYNFAALRLLFDAEPEECVSCDAQAYTDGIHDKCDYEFKAQFRLPNGGIGVASGTLNGELILKPSSVTVETRKVVIPDSKIWSSSGRRSRTRLTPSRRLADNLRTCLVRHIGCHTDTSWKLLRIRSRAILVSLGL